MKGWVVPANTPDAAVIYLHDRFRQAMGKPSWQAFLERAGETDGYLDGPAFQARWPACWMRSAAAEGVAISRPGW